MEISLSFHPRLIYLLFSKKFFGKVAVTPPG